MCAETWRWQRDQTGMRNQNRMNVTTSATASNPTDGTTDERRGGLFIGLSAKFVAGFTVLFALVFLAASVWLDNVVTDDALGVLKISLTEAVNIAAAGVNGDEFDALVREGQPNAAGQSDDPRYASQLAWLTTVHSLDPHANAYTYVAGPEVNGQPTNLFIAAYQDSGRAGRGFKEAWMDPNPASRAGFEQLTYQLTPYSDQWGTWVSAYTPIQDSSGTIVGALGVDYRADNLNQVVTDLLTRFDLPILVVYLVLVLLVLVVSRFLTRPLRSLAHGAERIAEGDYTLRLTDSKRHRLDDEISTLTRVFEVMVSRVREREQVLARKVERLTIEIDEAKRQQEVSQIVESDSFRSLQDRAEEMRLRRLNRSAADEVSDQGDE